MECRGRKRQFAPRAHIVIAFSMVPLYNILNIFGKKRNLSEGLRNMNIYDISEMAGVSIATVSRVLNGSKKVSDATRRKILGIIEETGYAPGMGRHKPEPRVRTVGILCTSLLSGSNAVTVEKLMRKLGASGFETDFLLCGSTPAAKRRAVEHFTRKKINALIIQGADFMEYEAADNSYISAAASSFPVILLNAFLDAPGVYCAFCDLASAVKTVTEALIKKGRRHPLFLFSSMSDHYILMLEAFKNTCLANGMDCRPEYVHLCPDAGSAKAYVSSLLENGTPADAAVTTDAASAYAVLCAASESGVSVPEDFETVGFGADCLYSSSSFISVYCREEEICAHAVNCVANLSNGLEAATLTVFPAIIEKT